MKKRTSVQTLGLDLGDTWTHWALTDLAGEVVDEGRVPTTSSELLRLLHTSDAKRVVLEAGSQSPWIDRLFRSEGAEVLVVNPNRLKAVSASIRKTDRNDARLLAELGYSGLLLWEVHHRSEDAQRGLQLLMARDKVVACRTKLVNQARGHAKSLGHPLPSCEASTFHRLRELALEIAPDLDLLFDMIEQLTRTIRSYDQRASAMVDAVPAAKLLMTAYGVGPVTALAFVWVLDDPARFESSRQVGPYLGLTTRLDQSGGLNKELRISKAGNSFLRRLLVSSAQTILRKNGKPSALRDWGLGLVERGGRAAKKRAAVAVARKLAVALHRMWTTGEAWRPYPNGEPTPA